MNDSVKKHIANRCVHFTGISQGQCRVGIHYNDVQDKTVKPFKIPCVINSTFSGGCCRYFERPTEKAVQQMVEDIIETQTNAITASKAIRFHAHKNNTQKGIVACPKCSGQLHYQIAPNNHIQSKCQECGLAFIE